MATIDLGKIKLTWKGTYNNSTAYVVDDVVEYTDTAITSTYICTTNSTGNAPSSSGTAHGSWAYMAKGAAGTPTTTRGDILYRGASADVRLAKGTDGQFLKIGANDPVWADVATDVSALRVDTLINSLQNQYDNSESFQRLGDSYADKFMDNRGLATQTNVKPAGAGYLCPWWTQGSYLNWRMLKKSGNGGGGYHRYIFLKTGSSLNSRNHSADEWSSFGVMGFNATNWVQTSGTDNAFHTDSAKPGAWVKLTQDGPSTITKMELYQTNPDKCVWDIQHSIDDVRWTTVYKNWDTDENNADGLVNATWNGTGGTNTSYYGENATGQIICHAQTATSARTKVGGVMLYENQAGTATLGTDIKVYFTCNGGTNWTEVSSFTTQAEKYAGIYSDDEWRNAQGKSLNIVKLNEVTCTSGTDIRYKIDWANQGSSKTSRVYGLGMYW